MSTRSCEHEELWRALCERVYPLRDALGMGDGRHLFHQDLPLLTDLDLELDKLRARFRVCLEVDFSDWMWLLERLDRIAEEQARRAEDAWPPRETGDVSTRPRTEPVAGALDSQRTGEAASEPPRSHLGHVGHRVGTVALTAAMQRMLEQLDRQAEVLAQDWERGGDGR